MKIIGGSNFPITLENLLMICDYKSHILLKEEIELEVDEWYILDREYTTLYLISRGCCYSTTSKVCITDIKLVWRFTNRIRFAPYRIHRNDK